MAEENENEAVVEGKSGGGMMKIILIVNAVLILIGIAVGATYFLMGGDDKETSAEDAEIPS